MSGRAERISWILPGHCTKKIWSQLQTMMYSLQCASNNLRVLNNPPFRHNTTPCNLSLMEKQYTFFSNSTLNFTKITWVICSFSAPDVLRLVTLTREEDFHHVSPLTRHSRLLARNMSPTDLNYWQTLLPHLKVR